MTADATSTAVDRETAWLATTGDALPTLAGKAAGQWDTVQAYWPGEKLDRNKSGVYVTRARLQDRRSGGVRLMPRYTFVLRLVWPLRNVAGAAGQGLAQTEQRNLDVACGALLLRIRGPVNTAATGPVTDKTHGGRFLSVGETPSGQAPEIVWDDPEITGPALRALRARVSYVADDFEVVG